MKRKKWTYLQKAWTAALLFVLLGAFLWCQNNWLCVTHLTVEADAARGLRIVQLSDLHGAYFGLGQQRLGAAVARQQPDLIVMTGDFIDKRGDERATRVLLKVLTGIAPVYCVTGNHEKMEMSAGRGTYERLLEDMEKSGAHLLRGEAVSLGEGIALFGIDDLSFYSTRTEYPGAVRELRKQAEGFSILLMHRPEMFKYAVKAGFDLVLSGHAHGGQFRLPFLGGLYAPGQGWFPEYTAGLYEDESGARLVVNRGLGSSGFPQRIFNRPEITVIDIIPKG